MERVSDLMTPEFLGEKPSNMSRDGGLADCTRDTDDVWLMPRDDESSKKCENWEEDMLHIGANHRE